MSWQGKTYRLSHDQGGQRFGSYDTAFLALGTIREQIEQKIFYPEHWASGKSNRFLWKNYSRDWLARRKPQLARSTYINHECRIRHTAWLDDRNIKEIRTAHLQDLLNLPHVQAMQTSTQRVLMALIRTILRDAEAREDIAKAPKVPMPLPEQQEVQWYTPEQQATLLENLPEGHRPIFTFLMLYGCRVGEVCALMWDAIDMREGLVWFRRTIAGGRLSESTKTRKARPAPLFDAALGVLSAIPKGIGRTPVFLHPRTGNGYTKQTLGKVYHRARIKAGLPNIPLKNATRHSRGMQLVNLMGGTVDDAAALLGHTTTSTTHRYYARPETARIKKLIDNPETVKSLSRANGRDDSDN